MLVALLHKNNCGCSYFVSHAQYVFGCELPSVWQEPVGAVSLQHSLGLAHHRNGSRTALFNCCCLTAAPQVCPPVLANSTSITFYLNTSASNASYAQEMCKMNGGHLAAFTSLEEQKEVEQSYIINGYLFPKWVCCKHIAAT
jgi:hypothetical protein